MLMIVFAGGMMLGGFVGILTMALMNAANLADVGGDCTGDRDQGRACDCGARDGQN